MLDAGWKKVLCSGPVLSASNLALLPIAAEQIYVDVAVYPPRVIQRARRDHTIAREADVWWRKDTRRAVIVVERR